MKCIKPSAGLINSFCNEICRERLLKLFFVLKRIMPLSIRHGAAVKPNIDQIGNTFHWLAAPAHQYYFINIRFVQIENAFMQIMLVDIAAENFICFSYSLI